MIGRFLTEASKNAAYTMVFGKLLKKTGGARLLTSSETGELLAARNTGLLIDGQNGRLSERESFQNVCVVARVGAGKTSRYIIPNVLDRAKRNCSIVVNDPKGEVFAETSGYLQSRGFKVIAINPEDLEGSNRFNPLLEARTDIEIEQIAEILIKAGAGDSKDPYIVANHGRKTHAKQFTAMMCVSNVKTLAKYYDLFKAKKAAGEHDLTVATIFSYQANEEDADADGMGAGDDLPDDSKSAQREIGVRSA